MSVVSVSELGFYRSAKYKDLCAKALELGLQLCPAEVGPALRLSYKDQPGGERLRIAMKAITDSYCDSIFEVVHEEELVYGEDELWLGGNCGVPDIRRRIRSRFVFVRPKPVSADEPLCVSHERGPSFPSRNIIRNVSGVTNPMPS